MQQYFFPSIICSCFCFYPLPHVTFLFCFVFGEHACAHTFKQPFLNDMIHEYFLCGLDLVLTSLIWFVVLGYYG